MENNKNSIFRKDALDKVTSPEELDRYLTVTRPGVWFVLIALIVLLAGFFVWAALGHLSTTANVAVISQEGQTICLVREDLAKDVLKNGSVKISGKEYKLSDVGYSPQIISESTDANIRLAGSLSINDIIVPLSVDGKLESGVYTGEVVIDTVKPISFILN